MKKSFTRTKRFLFFILTFFLTISFASSQVSKTVYYNSIADSLNVKLTSTEKSIVTDLKVITASGVYLTTSDWTVMKSMTALTNLDLSGSSVAATPTGLIPGGAFQNKTSLKTFKFPQNVKNIGERAFSGSGLTGTVIIPATVNTPANIKGRFDNCQNLTDFSVDPASTTIKTVDGVVFSYDLKTLALYPSGKQGQQYNIPEGTEILYDGAFAYNYNLTEITLPSTLNTFGTGINVITSSSNLQTINVSSSNVQFMSMGGILVDKINKKMMAFPPANQQENLVIDGSIVTTVPQYFFQMATKLKTIILTEGITDIGYQAFKMSSTPALEYVELPTSLLTIQGEAFANCSNLKQIICRATTPPDISGSATFHAHSSAILVGVPNESLASFKSSKWVAKVYTTGEGFTTSQFVAYRNITVGANVTCMQIVGVPTKSVSVSAGTAPSGQGFSHWESTPTTTFSSATSSVTQFIMPDADITVNAIYSKLMPYTIIDGITPSDSAVVGANVTITAAANKDGMLFKYWEIIEGTGMVLTNPQSTTTSFTMIDGPVTIHAIYEKAYTITIEGGYADSEAFSGANITIRADEMPVNYIFDHWETTTEGLIIKDIYSSITSFTMPSSDVYIKGVFKNVSGLNNPDEEKIFVYPNPATDKIIVSGFENTNFEIYDMSGRLVLKGTNDSNSPISIAQLIKGFYTIKVGSQYAKIIKK